jgi:hypothetical protein
MIFSALLPAPDAKMAILFMNEFTVNKVDYFTQWICTQRRKEGPAAKLLLPLCVKPLAIVTFPGSRLPNYSHFLANLLNILCKKIKLAERYTDEKNGHWPEKGYQKNINYTP